MNAILSGRGRRATNGGGGRPEAEFGPVVLRKVGVDCKGREHPWDEFDCALPLDLMPRRGKPPAA